MRKNSAADFDEDRNTTNEVLAPNKLAVLAKHCLLNELGLEIELMRTASAD
jgi:hypothetical protein